jgi:hypothetical protein
MREKMAFTSFYGQELNERPNATPILSIPLLPEPRPRDHKKMNFYLHVKDGTVDMKWKNLKRHQNVVYMFYITF